MMLPHLGGTENQKFMTNWKIIIIVCEIYNSKSKWPMLLNMSIHYNIFFCRWKAIYDVHKTKKAISALAIILL